MPSRTLRTALVAGSLLIACAVFAAGYQARQSGFGQPKTVIHVVSVQWKPGVSERDKAQVLDGVRKMAASIPGVKNVWVETERAEPRGFDSAFVIEFENRAAADAYASSAAHKSWNDVYVLLRAASVSIDVSNP